MSDTSIVEYDNYDDEPHHDSYRRRGNCWTNIGANICVGILAFTTIVLAAALAYVLYEQHQKENAIQNGNGNGHGSEYLEYAAENIASGLINTVLSGQSGYSE